MKKRRMVQVLGVTALVTLTAVGVQAKTYSYDLGGEKGSKILYLTEEAGSAGYSELENGTIIEYGSPEEISGLSKEEQKRLEDWHKEEMRNQLAYLEIYGVTYDAEKDEILYQGKTVRWLIDRQIDNTCMAIQMPEGEIDLYTERDDNLKLTGVRIASETEYEERTRKDKEAEDSSVQTQRTLIKSASEPGYTESVTSEARREEVVEVQEDRQESVTSEARREEAAEVQEDYQETEGKKEQTLDTCEETAVDSQTGSKENSAGDERRKKEYAQAGIGYDAQAGCWMWENQYIYMLLDEDGSLYTCGLAQAEKNKTYVVVKRNGDGSIKEANEVTIEEVMKEMMKEDLLAEN